MKQEQHVKREILKILFCLGLNVVNFLSITTAKIKVTVRLTKFLKKQQNVPLVEYRYRKSRIGKKVIILNSEYLRKLINYLIFNDDFY